jgi:hypothetical protein
LCPSSLSKEQHLRWWGFYNIFREVVNLTINVGEKRIRQEIMGRLRKDRYKFT